MSLTQVLAEVEGAGISLRLEGQKVRIRYPEPDQRERLAAQLKFLRANRDEVAAFLRTRSSVPTMPPGVRLLEWKLKEPPVVIETCAVVTDPALFARSTLDQLRNALTKPKRWVGWSVPQLIQRLSQVGVRIAIETKVGVQ